MITSKQHSASRTRISYFVLLQLVGPLGGRQLRVARVEQYLQVKPAPVQPQPASQPPLQLPADVSVLRLAICTVFAAKPMRGQLHVMQPEEVQYAGRAFSVDDIVTILVSVYPGRAAGTRQHDASDCGKILLMQYNNLSRM